MCPKTHACGTLPWTKSQQDRQGQCHQRTPLTGSLMSNSSGKRIMTTTRQYCLGVLTAHMTPTAQAGRKSWYVSASRGKRAFARARTPKENFRTTRLPLFLPPSQFFEKGNLSAAWRFQSWPGLQQRHTICIGARKDNYKSSLQSVDRFTDIVEDDAEHGYQQHSASLRHPAALGLWSTLPPRSISILGLTQLGPPRTARHWRS